MAPGKGQEDSRGSGARERILGLVRAAPGVHKSSLSRRLGMSWGSTTHHLRILHRKGLIRLVSEGREMRIFPPGVPEHHMRWLGALHNATDASILEKLRQTPGAGVNDLSTSLNASRRVISRHLGRLGEDGLVQGEGQRGRRFHLGPEWMAPPEVHLPDRRL